MPMSPRSARRSSCCRRCSGLGIASTLFAVALLASGLNSTVTATLAGQIVMEGFLHLRLPNWARRLVTRGIAIVPVVIVTAFYGERGTGQLLVFSQVVLSMQLPFAVIPLVRFVSDRRKMGEFAISRAGRRGGVDRRRHHRGAEREAAVRYVVRVSERMARSRGVSPPFAGDSTRRCRASSFNPAARTVLRPSHPRAASLTAPAAAAAGSGPCSPSSWSLRSSSRDRRKAVPAVARA